MGIRFQKRVSIFPGFRLNFSASGVSATIGMRGASVTLGGRGGPMANLGIPGSGLSTRFSLRGSTQQRSSEPVSQWPTAVGDPEAQKTLDHLHDRILQRAFGRSNESAPPPPPKMDTIGSAATSELTSPHLIELQNLIAEATARHIEAERLVAHYERQTSDKTRAVEKCRDEINAVQQNLHKWRKSPLRFFYGSKIRKAQSRTTELSQQAASVISDLNAARSSLQDAENARDESWLDGSFPLDGPASSAWRAVEQAFFTLSNSEKIWDLTAERHKRAGEERSSATRLLDRKTTNLTISNLEFFAPEFDGLRWHNANGDDLYLYPGLLLVARDVTDFAVIDLKSVKFEFDATKFDERETPPSDSKRVGSTWEYANKDGTRDLRYRDNREFPLMLYGQIRFRSDTGLNEHFMFSNLEACAGFSDALSAFEELMARSTRQKP